MTHRFIKMVPFLLCVYLAVFYVLTTWLQFDKNGGMSQVTYNEGNFTRVKLSSQVSSASLEDWLQDKHLEALALDYWGDPWTRYAGESAWLDHYSADVSGSEASDSLPQVYVFSTSYLKDFGYQAGDAIVIGGEEMRIAAFIPADSSDVLGSDFTYGYAPFTENVLIYGEIYINTTDVTLTADIRSLFLDAEIEVVKRPSLIPELVSWLTFNGQIMVILLGSVYLLVIVFLAISQYTHKQLRESYIYILLGQSIRSACFGLQWSLLCQNITSLLAAIILFRLFVWVLDVPTALFSPKGLLCIGMLFVLTSLCISLIVLIQHNVPIWNKIKKGQEC